MAELRDAPSPGLQVNKTGIARPPHGAIGKQSIDFYIRLASRLARIPGDVDQMARQVSSEIRDHFASDVDIYGIIIGKYREHMAARQIWSFVLARLGPVNRIVFVNDDSLKTLIWLARARNTETREIQHGYMGRSHVSYSYPQLDTLPETLPDSIVVTRDTGDITYPVTRIAAAAPAATTSVDAADRDIDVLIGASPTLAEETRAIAAALVDQGLSVGVKLHPIQTVETSGLRADFTPDQLAIHDGRDDFCTLVRRSRVYVPANPTSTTVFEAVENGAALIVVDFNGQKRTTLVDDILTARADSPEALANAIHTHLQEGSS